MKEERDAILLMGKLPLKEHAQPPETDRGGKWSLLFCLQKEMLQSWNLGVCPVKFIANCKTLAM